MTKMTSRSFFFLSAAAAVLMFFLSNYMIPSLDIQDATLLEVLLKTTRAERVTASCLAKTVLSASVSDWFMILLPLLVAMPFLFPLEAALNGGFYRFQLVRKSYRSYIFRTLGANLLSGAAAVTLGYALFAGIAYLAFPHYSELTDMETGEPRQFFSEVLGMHSELLAVGARMLIFFLFAMLVAGFCMLTTLLLLWETDSLWQNCWKQELPLIFALAFPKLLHQIEVVLRNNRLVRVLKNSPSSISRIILIKSGR